MKYISLLLLFTLVIGLPRAIAQLSTYPYTESFDSVIAPSLPNYWSVNGFEMSTATAKSPPNCICATGNMTSKSITSPVFDFTSRVPDKLVFWERRSNTAAAYRFEIRASLDGVNYDYMLGLFDTISSMSNYIQRFVNLNSSGLQHQPYVQFQWRLLGDGLNNTGVLKIDDVLLTMMTASDVGISGIDVSQSAATRNDSLTISTIVKNYGTLTAYNFSVRFFHDDNYNHLAESEEQLSVVNVLSLNPDDSLSCEFRHLPLKVGRHSFIAIVDLIFDENRANDTGRVDIYVGCDKYAILVNEIMYDPLNSQNEWLELYNRSMFPIDLAHWTFNDKPTSTGINSFKISDTSLIVYSGCFAIVAAESSVCSFFPDLAGSDLNRPVRILNRVGGFGFNNDGDIIVLKDFENKTIDSVNYSPLWHNPNVVDAQGRSLERINPSIDSNDPRNWSTCTNNLGGTPGRANSVFTRSIASDNKITISPNPFSPDGDGFEDFCMINYNLSPMTSTLRVKIYDIKGRLVRTLIDGEVAGNQGDIIWDGLDDSRQRARIGVFIIYLEATDMVSRRTITAKAVAVVATRF